MPIAYMTVSKTIPKATATSQIFNSPGMSAIDRVCVQYKNPTAASNTSKYATGLGKNTAGTITGAQCAFKPANGNRTYESIFLKGVSGTGVLFQSSGAITCTGSNVKGVFKTTGMTSDLVVSVTTRGTVA